MGRSTGFTGSDGAAWPLSAGSWSHSTLLDTGTIAAATPTILTNKGRETCTAHNVNVQMHVADTAFTARNPEVRCSFLASGYLVSGLNTAVCIKMQGAGTLDKWYQAMVTATGKTGIGAKLAIIRRDNLISATELVSDTDISVGGNNLYWIAFRAYERSSEVLLQAKAWTDAAGEPAWPDITDSGTPTANPTDGVLQAVDSTSGLWDFAGTIGISNTYSRNPTVAKLADRGTFANNALQAATVVTLTTGASIATTNYLIARIAADNSGLNGALPGVTITDTPGNTWSQTSVLNDPGVASAGVAGYLAYTKVTNAYANNDTISFTWGSAVVAKAIVVEEWSGIDTTTPVAVAATSTTATGTTITVSRTPTAAGQVFYGMCAVEGPTGDAFSGDADTTDGVWGNLTRLSGGTTAAGGMTINGQAKTVTGTTAQTWDSTITTRDSATIGIIFNDAVSPPAWTLDHDDFNADDVTRVLPPAIAAVAAVDAPTVSGTASHVASVITAISAVNAPTIVAGSATDHVASVIAAISAVNAPTIVFGQTHAASVITAVAAVAAPTFVAGSSHAAEVIAAISAVNTPTIVTTALVTPTTIAAIASVNTPTVSGTATHTATTIVAVSAVNAPTILASSTHLATTIVAVAAVGAPTVVAGSTHVATTIAAIATVDAVTIFAGGNATIAASVIAATALVNTPTILTSSTHLADVIAAIAAVAAPTVSLSFTVQPDNIVAISSVNAPTVVTTATFEATTIATIAALYDPTILTTTNVEASVIVGLADVLGPSFVVSITAFPDSIDISALVPDPDIIIGLNPNALVFAEVIAAIAAVAGTFPQLNGDAFHTPLVATLVTTGTTTATVIPSDSDAALVDS